MLIYFFSAEANVNNNQEIQVNKILEPPHFLPPGITLQFASGEVTIGF